MQTSNKVTEEQLVNVIRVEKSHIPAKEKPLQKLALLRVWLLYVFTYLSWKSALFPAKLYNHLCFS